MKLYPSIIMIYFQSYCGPENPINILDNICEWENAAFGFNGVIFLTIAECEARFFT